jgi:hypothetical protein
LLFFSPDGQGKAVLFRSLAATMRIMLLAFKGPWRFADLLSCPARCVDGRNPLRWPRARSDFLGVINKAVVDSGAFAGAVQKIRLEGGIQWAQTSSGVAMFWHPPLQ